LSSFAEPIVINLDDRIIGGHARVQALKRIKGKAAKVEVYVPDRLLNEKELAELLIRLNKNVAGEFDMDMLANDFDVHDLVSFSFEPHELGITAGTDSDDSSEANGDAAGDKPVKPQIIHCPKCDHEFSVVEKKKDKSAD
jgi:hypothetical protein